MKSFIASLLAASVVATTWEQDQEITKDIYGSIFSGTTPKQDSDLAAGIFWGIMEKEDLPQLEHCTKDADIFSVNILKSFQLMSYTPMDFQHVEAGVRLLASSISGITSIIGNCEQTKADLDVFENWAKVFLHPKQLKPIV